MEVAKIKHEVGRALFFALYSLGSAVATLGIWVAIGYADEGSIFIGAGLAVMGVGAILDAHDRRLRDLGRPRKQALLALVPLVNIGTRLRLTTPVTRFY